MLALGLSGCPRGLMAVSSRRCLTALTEKRAAIGLRVTLSDPERQGIDAGVGCGQGGAAALLWCVAVVSGLRFGNDIK